MISIIAAVVKNGAIGKESSNSGLPWRLIPEDMKFFRNKTINNIAIMGRKTFDFFYEPLPYRKNIIISKTMDLFDNDGYFCIFNNIEYALNSVKNDKREKFIIGGGILFSQSIQYCNRMYITEIDQEFNGDTFFPKFDKNDWIITESVEKKEIHEYNYKFVTYERKIHVQD